MIELFRPWHDEREVEAVSEVLRTDWWGLGGKTKQFEDEFAKKIGVKHAVAVNSCTSALQLAMFALPELPVIVPAISFIATAFAPLYEGRPVYFADVEPDYLTLDKSSVERIKLKYDLEKAIIIPVHLYGNLANTNYPGDFVVEDCAHACGTTKLEEDHFVANAGAFGEISCFSFHAVKNLACGDGGMVCTGDDNIADKLRRARWFGITKSTFDRTAQGYGWDYDIPHFGYKMHMNDITAAIGLVQLDKLEDGNNRRRSIAETYRKELASESWLKLPKVQSETLTSQHIFAIRTEKRNELNKYLKEHFIATGVHYKPMYEFSFYKGIKQDCPVADKEWKKLLSLPCYPDLSELEQDTIIKRIKEFGRIYA